MREEGQQENVAVDLPGLRYLDARPRGAGYGDRDRTSTSSPLLFSPYADRRTSSPARFDPSVRNRRRCSGRRRQNASRPGRAWPCLRAEPAAAFRGRRRPGSRSRGSRFRDVAATRRLQEHVAVMDHCAVARPNFRRLNPVILMESRIDHEILIFDGPLRRHRERLGHGDHEIGRGRWSSPPGELRRRRQGRPDRHADNRRRSRRTEVVSRGRSDSDCWRIARARGRRARAAYADQRRLRGWSPPSRRRPCTRSARTERSVRRDDTSGSAVCRIGAMSRQ